ncbi:hypothetical protein KCP73_25340 [Salmonella enterica subsp. enterica]|nr:hypothetical protein KCP73_25340 [Salmonella enterica subsp. enterica]
MAALRVKGIAGMCHTGHTIDIISRLTRHKEQVQAIACSAAFGDSHLRHGEGRGWPMSPRQKASGRKNNWWSTEKYLILRRRCLTPCVIR